MAKIDIRTALAQMQTPYDENGNPNVFTITFVKQDGSLRKIEKAACRQTLPSASPKKTGLGYNLKATHTILVYEIGQETPKTIHIPTIIKYNENVVIH